jgi:pectate lyase
MSTRMMHRKLFACSALAGWSILAASAVALPAFPGAEGFGTQTPGGRGGRVIEVTTLEDDGPGSLREAVTAKGPRTIVFHVGGTIRLKSHLRVTEPFVTIAGQTAPGSGILLRDACLFIQTHDVVVRFIRSRVGASLVEGFNTQNAVQVEGDDAFNIVVDHCSFSWSIDECVGVRIPVHDTTFSWNLVGEGLRQPFTKEQIGKDRSHSMAWIMSGGPTRCTMHHNLLALCNSRNPRIQGGRHAFINNVIYGWGSLTGMFSRNPEVNFIGNFYKPGPFSRAIKAICDKPEDLGQVYVRGNRSPDRPNNSLPEWELTVNAPSAGHEVKQPFEMAPIRMTSAEEAYDAVLCEAGAILPARDPVDRRIVRYARLSMGRIIDRPDEAGGYPEMVSGPVPADSDHDGMPDDWEVAEGFDPHDAADGAGDADHDGYTNLEQYLESLVQEGLTSRPMVAGLSVDRIGGPFNIQALGRPLPVVRVGGDDRSFYTHVYFEGPIEVQIRETPAPAGSLSTEPPRFRDRWEVKDGSARFRVEEEGFRLIEQGPAGKRLLAFFDVDPGEGPHLDGKEVIDVRRYGIFGGRADVTDKLQAALNAAAKIPGGVVFVPDGDNEIDSVRIPGGVTLYLAVSSALYSTARPGKDAMFVFEKAENSVLRGPGVIDGRGDEEVPARPLVSVRDCKSVLLTDVVLRNPSGRGIEISGSDNVGVYRAKVMAVGHRPEIGGLSISGCRSVRCERSFISGTGAGILVQSPLPGGSSGPLPCVAILDSAIMSEGEPVVCRPEDRASGAVLVRDVDVPAPGGGFRTGHPEK